MRVQWSVMSAGYLRYVAMDKTITLAVMVTMIFFIVKTGAMDCPKENDTLYSADRKLHKALLCNYDPEIVPVKDSSKKVNVSLELMIKHIETNDEQQNEDTITVHTWMSLQWDDEFLVWNKSKHSDITTTRIFSNKIWTPQIVVYNSDTSHVAGAYEFSADCVVYYRGLVVCVFHASHVASCEMDLMRWPYDTQNCSFSFKNLIFKGGTVNLSTFISEEKYILENYKPNRFWQLLSVNVSRLPGYFPKMSNPTISFNLILKRHTATQSILIIVPAIAMIALTVTSIMMKISTSHRIYLIAINLLLHFLYIQNLSYYAPSHGDQCPMVVIFYRDSLVVTASVLTATAILKMLTGRSTPIPKWIDNIIAVANSTPGQLVMYASDDADDLDRIVPDNSTDQAEKAEQRHFQDWKNFVKIMNRLLFLAVIVTYFVTDVSCVCVEDSDLSATATLRRKLLCNYDRDLRPVKDHNTATDVGVILLPTYISTEDQFTGGDTITVHSWFYLMWVDEYLTWNPAENDNIRTIHIWSELIWLPQIVVMNSGPTSLPSPIGLECMVEYDGEVHCPLHEDHVAVCDNHVRHWPYDWQNCSLIFKTMMYRGEEINLTKSYEIGFTLDLLKPNPSWTLENVEVSKLVEGFPEQNITFPSIRYDFTLTRQSAIHAATIVIPAFVLLALTLISLTMPIESFERVYILVIDLFCHFSCLMEMVSWKIPFIGDEYPLITVFFRDSTVVCVVIIIMTVFMRKLLAKKTSVPSWVDLIIELSQKAPIKWIMYATNQKEPTVIIGETVSEVAAQVDKRNKQEWIYFVVFVNRCLFLVTFLIYFGLLVSFLF